MRNQLFLAVFFLVSFTACVEPNKENSEIEGNKTTTTSVTSSSKVETSGSLTVGGSASVSTSTTTTTTSSTARIPLEKGKQYTVIGLFDFDEEGDVVYKEITLPKPTIDPLYVSMDMLTKGNLRRYVRNLRLTKVTREGNQRQLYFKGIPAFENKAAEKEFLSILHQTAKVYTDDYKFFINDRVFE